MIKFGKSLCLKCCNESDEWLYYLPQENVILRAVKNQFGIKLVLAEESQNSGYQIHMRKKPKLYKGLPHDFFVTVEKEEGVEKKISKNHMITPKNRICPYCKRIDETISHLPEWMGYQDTIVIGVLGRSSSGKTAYLESCAAPVNLKNSRFGTDDFSIGEMNKLTVTPISEREGMYKSLILENKKGKILRVVLMDTPGEILDDKKSKDTHESDYDWNIQRLNICDAFLYFFDGIYRNGSDAIHWKNRMKKNMDYIDPDTPIAIVTTKLDLMELECKKNGGILRTREGIPVLTENYFSENRGTTIDMKAKQLLIDKKISRELNDDIAVVVPENKKAGYFLVSSGSNKEDGEMLYFANSRRLYEPLEFLLLEMGAFDD